MNKLLLVFLFCLLLPGCFNLAASGYGMFTVDPGVRIMKDETSTSIHITYKQGLEPEYKDIALIVKEALK